MLFFVNNNYSSKLIYSETYSQSVFTCSKLTIKSLKTACNMSKMNKKIHQNNVNWHKHMVSWSRSGMFHFNFEHILLLVLLFLMFSLNQFDAGYVRLLYFLLSWFFTLINLQSTNWCYVKTTTPFVLSISSSDIF